MIGFKDFLRLIVYLVSIIYATKLIERAMHGEKAFRKGNFVNLR